jgi:hypothetical protein
MAEGKGGAAKLMPTRAMTSGASKAMKSRRIPSGKMKSTTTTKMKPDVVGF